MKALEQAERQCIEDTGRLMAKERAIQEARARDQRRWQEWQDQKEEARAYLEGKLNEYLPCPDYGRMPNPPNLSGVFDCLDGPATEVEYYDFMRRSLEDCDASLEWAVKAVWARAEQAERTMQRVAECLRCPHFFRCAVLSGRFAPVCGN